MLKLTENNVNIFDNDVPLKISNLLSSRVEYDIETSISSDDSYIIVTYPGFSMSLSISDDEKFIESYSTIEFDVQQFSGKVVNTINDIEKLNDISQIAYEVYDEFISICLNLDVLIDE